jgi:FkbM family methyltransferase
MMNRYDRSFWVLDNQKLSFLDLEERWKSTGGDTNGGTAYQYFEMFHCDHYTDTGCDYERRGCQIQPGDVVVDIGGNIGVFARRAWERGASEIFSFEPQRDAFLCYLKNSKPEMTAFNIGLADKIGSFELTFGESVNNSGGGSMFANYEQRGIEILHREKVLTITFDHLFSAGLLNRVDFLKIDCEGAEGKVLQGISDDNLRKFRCVAMEIHRTVIDDAERDRIVARMTRLGYLHFAMFYGGDLATYNFWR